MAAKPPYFQQRVFFSSSESACLETYPYDLLPVVFQGVQSSLFQLTEFQLTLFQFTEFQFTEFQFTEFQLTLFQFTGVLPVHRRWLAMRPVLLLRVLVPWTAA